MTTYLLQVTRDGAERIDALVPFAGRDTGRPVLQAVAFGADRIAATDSYALAWIEPVETAGEDAPERPLVWCGPGPAGEDLPLVDARELRRALKGIRPPARSARAFATLTFDTDAGTVTLDGNGRSVTLPLTDGQYPNVAALIPERTADQGGYMPAVSAELVGRFAKLATAVDGHGSTTVERAAVVLIPHDGPESKPIVVETVGRQRLGLLMPVRADHSVAAVRARVSV